VGPPTLQPVSSQRTCRCGELHQRSLESSADAPSPPFPVAERQSATLTMLCTAPTQLSSTSMGRIPAVPSIVAPTPRHSRRGLPLGDVRAVYGPMVARCLPVPSPKG
jgi:hypothetical protein